MLRIIAPYLAVVTGLLLACSPTPIEAQSYLTQTGTPTFTTAQPVELGFLNLGNGNLHQEIGLGSFPQRGARPFGAELVYDSRIWQIATIPSSSWQPTNVPNSQGGWRFITSADVGTVGFQSSSDGGRPPTITIGPATWTLPSGTARVFPVGATVSPCTSSSSGGFATDATGYWMNLTNTCGVGLSWTIYAPDGTLVSTNAQGSPKDTNGNYFTKDANGNVIDTLDRKPIVVTTSCNGNSAQTCYAVLNSQGNTSTYTVTTTTINVTTAFGVSGVTEYSGTLTVVQKITLPDGTLYQFGYDSYGELNSVTLPTLGQVTYGYTNYQDSFGSKNRWATSRVSGGGTWNYTPTVITTCGTGQVGCQQKVTVTKPSTDTTVYTFILNNGAWKSQVQAYTGSTTLLSTASSTWDFSQSCSPTPCTGASSIRILTTTTTLPTPGGNNVTSQTKMAYTDTHTTNLASVKTWKFYAGISPTFPATPDRETDFTYLSTSAYTAKNILNRVLQTTVKDSGGNVVGQTNFSYDDSGALSNSTPASGIWQHDDTGFGITNTTRGNLTTVKRCTVFTACSTNNLQTLMTYDTTGQVLSINDPNTNTTIFGYTDNFFQDSSPPQNPPATLSPAPPAPTNAYRTSMTQPLVGTTTSGYYYGTGKHASTTDPNNANGFSHFLDALDRLTHTFGPLIGGNRPWSLNVYASTETQLDSYIGITDATASASCTNCRNDRLILDNLGRAVTQTLVSDPDGATSTDTAYDATGRIQSASHPHRSAASATDGLETPTYDGLNRVTKTTHQDGTYSQVFVGAAVGGAGLNARTTQSCSSTTYGLGYPTLFINEAGKKRETWTDGFGRTIEGDEPDSSGNLSTGAAVCYLYDALGNLMQVVSGSQTRTYTYDALSRATSVSIPEISNSSGQQCAVTYAYDNNGNVLSRTAPAPNQTACTTTVTATYSYDSLNRLGQVSYSDGTTPTVRYGYDGTALTGCATAPPALTDPNPKGRRTSVCDGSGAVSWSHDAAGRITAESRTILGITKNISYGYNLDGSMASIVYPSTKTATYTVSNAQRQTSAKDLASGAQFAITATYAPPGQLQSMITGQISGGFGGITESHTYNSSLEYASTQATSTAGTALNLTVNHDPTVGANGSVTSIGNNVDTGRTISLGYDSLNRIVNAQSAATSGIDCWGQNFGPDGLTADDALANLTKINSGTQNPPLCAFGLLNATVDANNHINTDSTYAYDAAGNMTKDGSGTGWLYTFDAEGRLTLATGPSGGPYCYVYDGLGLRVAKKSGATACSSVTKLYWRSITGGTFAETDGSGSTTNSAYNEYLFFVGRRIAQRTGPGAIFYYFADQVGSTRSITTGSGTGQTPGQLCYDADFTPYGQEISHSERLQTTPCPTNYKFTGYERDTETGLDYAFARYYSSRLGRFLSTDPLRGAIGNLQSHNAYAYVTNNPLDAVDPSGMDGCPPQAPAGTNCGPPSWVWDDHGSVDLAAMFGMEDVRMGLDIFDAVAGAPGTWWSFTNGQLVWGVDLGSSAFNPFAYRFTGTLYGTYYEQTFGTWDDYANWATDIAASPQSQIYQAFMVLARNQGWDPNDPQEMGYKYGALVYSVWVDGCDKGQGCTVAEDNLDGFWKDPITLFHQGNPSWYEGFLFDTPHLVGGDPMSAHIDPFGPLNPLHYLIQLPAMLFPGGSPGTATCSINGGCTIH